MPGLKQLEKFSNDIHGLGDEEQIRAKRGERMSVVPLPEGIPEEDDSDEFILGLPEAAGEDVAADGAASASEGAGDAPAASDDGGLGVDDLAGGLSMDDIVGFGDDDAASLGLPQSGASSGDVDMDAMLGGGSDASSDSSSGDVDMDAMLGGGSDASSDSSSGDVDMDAMLGGNSEPSSDSSAGEMDMDAMLGGGSDASSDSSAGDMDMDALLGGNSEPSADSSAGDMDMDALLGGNSEPSSDSSAGEMDMDALLGGGSDATSDSAGGMDMGSLGGGIPDASESVPDDGAGMDMGGSDSFDSSEIDMSAMDGMDFGEKGGGSPDEEFPETHVGGDEDDFLLSDDFEISGFTDTESADMGRKVDTVDFKNAKSAAPVQRSSLTDEEYAKFRKHLSEYPLNLKVIVEDAIAKDGDDAFKDETLFEIIDLVLRRTSAQKLAAYMEKLLDVQIQIPRDFEHRSYEQYEAYKQSFQYQLKNRIIPGAIVGVILLFVGLGLFKAGKHFIYEPLVAISYYKEGLAQLENNEYPGSEENFRRGVEYRPIKSWFFDFARGYRAHRQFERAAQMYRNILRHFDNDKEAGLEYARMELEDRADYAEAERIVRRAVLDNHINDPDGELLLGDIYLEWAEEDPSKYDDALLVYAGLETRFPKDKLYSSRMLRYYIRTDKLREVLVYKSKFYPEQKSLGAEDWTELSGYLLDKLYGEISRNDEYLRASIEDVLKMLEYAVRSDPSSPVARYNLGRYYIHNGYKDRAQAEMENALALFDRQHLRTKRSIYNEINASRILGELYVESREYDKAQKVFTRGIDRYNEEHLRTGLPGDENTGRLFSDIGDIDYFITGDIDSALTNYETAIATRNDTPSLNYRVGAIRYGKKDYTRAFAAFVKVSEKKSGDANLLLALGNVLALRGDNFAAQSCYANLLRRLDTDRALLGVLKPQEDLDDGWLVDMYLKANNNLGVTLFRLARQTGNSNYGAEAMTRFSDSMRAWDALTRDQQTMLRLDGGNLAGQNAKFVAAAASEFEPAIYTDIPRTLLDEKILH